MALSFKSYRFALPPPAFDESNNDKGHWDIIFTTEVNLDDYPLHYEVLGVEFIVTDRLYNGHNTHFHAEYTNKDTGAHIFTSDQDIPDPSESGYTYWYRYRICSWIGHCSWEIPNPMNIKIYVTITSDTLGTHHFETTMHVTGTVPGPEPCPDFWVDPVGAVMCWVLGAFEAALGFITGGFMAFQEGLLLFLIDWGSTIIDFFKDPVSKIQAWVSDIIPTLSDWWDGIIDGIGAWWDGVIPTVQSWISDAISGFTSWIDEGFSNIGAWWESTSTSLLASVNNLISGAVDYMMGGFASIGDWWNGTISSVSTWISDAINATIEFILDGFNSIGDWWTTTWISVITWVNDAITAAAAWVTAGITDFAEWVSGLGEGFIDWINGIISDIQEWVEDIVPGIVEGMLGFLAPIVQPIIDAVGFLGQIIGVFTGEREKEQEIKDAETTITEEYDAVKEIIDSME